MIDVDRANANANNLEKKQRGFDKTIAEWEARVRDLQTELENAQKEARSYSAELYRTKAQAEEANDTIDSLKRENKNLAGMFNFCCAHTLQYPFQYLYTIVSNICLGKSHSSRYNVICTNLIGICPTRKKAYYSCHTMF
jgi:hypothetical protein